MSEGELKREIYKTAEYEHDRGLRSVRVEFAGEIEYILDEAKREFPTIEKVGDKLAEQFNAPYSERMLYVAFITEMRTWFKKWFGRAEE